MDRVSARRGIRSDPVHDFLMVSQKSRSIHPISGKNLSGIRNHPRPVLLHRRDFLFPDPGTAHPARRGRTTERGAAAGADCFF